MSDIMIQHYVRDISHSLEDIAGKMPSKSSSKSNLSSIDGFKIEELKTYVRKSISSSKELLYNTEHTTTALSDSVQLDIEHEEAILHILEYHV